MHGGGTVTLQTSQSARSVVIEVRTRVRCPAGAGFPHLRAKRQRPSGGDRGSGWGWRGRWRRRMAAVSCWSRLSPPRSRSSCPPTRCGPAPSRSAGQRKLMPLRVGVGRVEVFLRQPIVPLLRRLVAAFLRRPIRSLPAAARTGTSGRRNAATSRRRNAATSRAGLGRTGGRKERGYQPPQERTYGPPAGTRLPAAAGSGTMGCRRNTSTRPTPDAQRHKLTLARGPAGCRTAAGGGQEDRERGGLSLDQHDTAAIRRRHRPRQPQPEPCPLRTAADASLEDAGNQLRRDTFTLVPYLDYDRTARSARSAGSPFRRHASGRYPAASRAPGPARRE